MLCLCPVGYDDFGHRARDKVSHVQWGPFLKVGPTPRLECIHPAASPEHRANLDVKKSDKASRPFDHKCGPARYLERLRFVTAGPYARSSRKPPPGVTLR